MGEPQGTELDIGIGLPNDGRQLEHLSPQVLYLWSQKQVLSIRHRQDGI